MTETKRSLYLSEDGDRDCDGCGREIPSPEPALDGIESCCGGCYRALCRDCVMEAAAMILRAEQEVEEAELEAMRARLDAIKRGVQDLSLGISRAVLSTRRVGGRAPAAPREGDR